MLLVSVFTFTHTQTLEPFFCLIQDRVILGGKKSQSKYNLFSGHSVRLSLLPGTSGCEARDFSCAYTAVCCTGQSLTWTMTTLAFSWLCTRFVRLLCLVLWAKPCRAWTNTLMIHHPPMQQQRVAQLPEQTDFCCDNFQETRGNHCRAINREENGNASTANAAMIVILVSLGHCSNPSTTAADHSGVGFNLSNIQSLNFQPGLQKKVMPISARTYTTPKQFAGCSESPQKLLKVFWVFWMCF